MKILFFGMGSIGRRHAMLISKLYPEHELFAFRTYKGQLKDPIDINEIYNWKQVDNIKPDTAFITNPTYLHINTALKCAKRNMNIFIEKPIDCSDEKMNDLLKEVEKRNLITYVAYVLRFHPIIDYLKNNLDLKKISRVEVRCRSNFPDWRINQDHLKLYSAFEAKGGGVLLELSHEIDYINYLFEKIEGISGQTFKKYNVTVDTDDYANLNIRTSTVKRINLILDIGSLTTERYLKIFFKENGYLTADLINREISFTNKRKPVRFEMAENDIFEKQLVYFFNRTNDNNIMNSLPKAGKLFRKILKLKRNLI